MSEMHAYRNSQRGTRRSFRFRHCCRNQRGLTQIRGRQEKKLAYNLNPWNSKENHFRFHPSFVRKFPLKLLNYAVSSSQSSDFRARLLLKGLSQKRGSPFSWSTVRKVTKAQNRKAGGENAFDFDKWKIKEKAWGICKKGKCASDPWEFDWYAYFWTNRSSILLLESPPRVLRSFEIGASPSGKAQDFDSCSRGSIPSAPAITFKKNERRRDASFAKNNWGARQRSIWPLSESPVGLSFSERLGWIDQYYIMRKERLLFLKLENVTTNLRGN